MRFSGVTLAAVTPYNREKSVHILVSTIIYFGADGSNRLIKFGVLFDFCVLMYYLGIFISQKWMPLIYPLLILSYHLKILNPWLFLHNLNHPSLIFTIIW